MVAEVQSAFEDGLKDISWMDQETKRAAKEKVGENAVEGKKRIEKSFNFLQDKLIR